MLKVSVPVDKPSSNVPTCLPTYLPTYLVKKGTPQAVVILAENSRFQEGVPVHTLPGVVQGIRQSNIFGSTLVRKSE